MFSVEKNINGEKKVKSMKTKTCDEKRMKNENKQFLTRWLAVKLIKLYYSYAVVEGKKKKVSLVGFCTVLKKNREKR